MARKKKATTEIEETAEVASEEVSEQAADVAESAAEPEQASEAVEEVAEGEESEAVEAVAEGEGPTEEPTPEQGEAAESAEDAEPAAEPELAPVLETELFPELAPADATGAAEPLGLIGSDEYSYDSSDSSDKKKKNKHGAHAAPKENKHRVRKFFLGLLIFLLAAVALTYVAGVIAFNFFIAMPNTTVGGRDVSWQMFSDIAAAQETKVASYTTTVTGSEYSADLKGSDIGLSLNQEAYAQGLADQQAALTWPVHIMESHELSTTAGISYDESKLENALSAGIVTHNETATQPVDATVGYVEAEGGFAVVPEQVGTALEAKATYNYIGEQLGSLPKTIKLDDSCYVQAAIKSDDPDLATAAQNANVFLKCDIPLTMNGLDAGSITKAQIAEWITIASDQSASLDEAKLAEWVKANIAAKYDTAGGARTYTRPDGKVVTVDATTANWGNYYGWLTDEASLVSLITDAVKNGKTDTIEIPTKQTANQVPDEGGRDWGNRYIDCDLSEQYVRMYDDSGNCIWETSCVTGKTSDGHGTPAGVYVLNNYKQSGNVKLTGAILPSTGEPEYISYVTYWMPFIDNSYAFHDASWRGSFGGSIYVYNGSHGCVNLPSGKAAELYNLCQVGDVVVVHW